MRSALVFSVCLLSLYAAAISKKEHFKLEKLKNVKESYANRSIYSFIGPKSIEVKWSCGPQGSDMAAALSLVTVGLGCSAGAKNLFMYACMKHDNCYACGRGQFYCDQKFCGMLDSAVILGGNVGSCNTVSNIFCKSVNTLGGAAYKADSSCLDTMNDEFAV